MVLPIDVLFRSRASGALWRAHVMLCGERHVMLCGERHVMLCGERHVMLSGERDALRPPVFPSYSVEPGL